MRGQEIDIMRDNPNSEETLSGSGAPPLDSRDNLLSRTTQPVARTIPLAHYPPLIERRVVGMVYYTRWWKHPCPAKSLLSRWSDFLALYS